jgi:transcription-repair coupling factor (superfamily II helicase)
MRDAPPQHEFKINQDDYEAFAQAFPFEETPVQEEAIQAVLYDMASTRHTDRLVCGDVGFGKTEVAMRAAFIAVMDSQQVASAHHLTSPTTRTKFPRSIRRLARSF